MMMKTFQKDGMKTERKGKLQMRMKIFLKAGNLVRKEGPPTIKSLRRASLCMAQHFYSITTERSSKSPKKRQNKAGKKVKTRSILFVLGTRNRGGR